LEIQKVLSSKKKKNLKKGEKLFLQNNTGKFFSKKELSGSIFRKKTKKIA